MELDGHEVTGAEDLVEANRIKEPTELGEEVLAETGAKVHGEHLTGHGLLLGSESAGSGMFVTLMGRSRPCQGKGGAFAMRHEDEGSLEHVGLAARFFPLQRDFLAAAPVVCFAFDMGGDSQGLTETSGLRCLACLSDPSMKFSGSTAYSTQAISLASLG
jgi:hypothetical protein